MASCTRIAKAVQAYLDHELSHSERVIFDQHLSECPLCRAELQRHQRMAAVIFEVYSEERLERDITPSVLENLPHMETPADDLRGVNWRAKHPVGIWGRVVHWVPASVMVGLVVVMAVIWQNWPEQEVSRDAIGVVLQSQGEARMIESDGTAYRTAAVRNFVRAGEYYETSQDATLMIALAGETRLKLNEMSRIRIQDNRRIAVEKGRAWLEIGRDGRLFRVKTATGEITVFGTSFEVRIDPGATTVTVEDGEVKVESDTSFRSLAKGQQVRMATGRDLPQPQEVNVLPVKAWAEDIQAERSADELFRTHIAARYETTPLLAEQVFMVNTVRDDRPRAVAGFQLRWDASSSQHQACDYNLYVTDGLDRPLFKRHIPAEAFASSARNRLDVTVPDGPIRDEPVLHIRIVADRQGNQTQLGFTDVSAIGMQ